MLDQQQAPDQFSELPLSQVQSELLQVLFFGILGGSDVIGARRR